MRLHVQWVWALVAACSFTAVTGSDHSVCGSGWQKKYNILWTNIMQKEESSTPKKYVINLPVRAGFADMILGFVTGFILAILDDRAFLITRMEELDEVEPCIQRMIEYGFAPRHFNWTTPWDIDRKHFRCVLPPYGQAKNCDGGVITSIGNKSLTHTRVMTVNDRSTMRGFRGNNDAWRDIRTLGDKADIIFHTGNRGATYNIFNNTHHGDKLRSLGFTPVTMHSCIFHYLFKKLPETCTGECLQVERKLQEAASSNNTIVIGVQVRRPNQLNVDEHFACADDLAEHYRSQGKIVKYLFVCTDRTQQESIIKKYGEENIFLPSGRPIEATPVHDNRLYNKGGDEGNMTTCEKNHEMDRQAILDSVRDMHLLSLADMAVISRDSGFGPIGYLMTPHARPKIYRMPENGTPPLKCASDPGLNGHDMSLFADSWSGLR